MSLFRRVVEQVVEEGLANANRDEDEEKDENASTKTRVPRLVHAWRGKRYLGRRARRVRHRHHAFSVLGGVRRRGVSVTVAFIRRVISFWFENALDETLSHLLSVSFADGNLPSSASSKSGNALVQWCHGAPGLIVLLAQRLRMAIRAGESVASRDFLAHKTRVATECVWRRGLTKKGPGLCHGASGNGYALLVAARALMPVDPILGRLLEARAKRFALWVTEHAAELAAERADAPGSLFEGLAGAVAFVVADAADASDAWFPGSEA